MACVLIVEDEALVRYSLVESLRLRQYQVDEASDGHTAIYLLRVKRFDAVICDYRIPGKLNGLDVLTYYHRACPAKVKVLISGLAAQFHDQLQAIGGIYLRKPFSTEDLLRILDHVI